MLPEDDRMIETITLATNKVCFLRIGSYDRNCNSSKEQSMLPDDDRMIETVTLARNKLCFLRMIV